MLMKLNILSSPGHCERLHLECLKCLKAMLNTTVGLDNFRDQSNAITLLARLDIHNFLSINTVHITDYSRSVIPDKPLLALESVKLLSCLSIVSQEWYDLALEGITEAAEIRGTERFQAVVQGKSLCNFLINSHLLVLLRCNSTMINYHLQHFQDC